MKLKKLYYIIESKQYLKESGLIINHKKIK